MLASAKVCILRARVDSRTLLRQLKRAIGLYAPALVESGLPAFLRIMVLALFHDAGHLPFNTQVLRRLARRVVRASGDSLMTWW